MQNLTLNCLNLVFELRVQKPSKFDILAHLYKFDFNQNSNLCIN